MTVHLVVESDVDAETTVLPEIRRRLEEAFGINHVTVQCERTRCQQIDEADHFKGAPA